MRVVPISLATAKAFIGEHHRHNAAPQGWKFGAGLYDGDEMVGVVVAGRPVARNLDDGVTLEITRVCVRQGQKNANSMLYGAAIRAGRSLGYQRFVTYTLPDESGSSLKAVGFREDGRTRPDDWNRPGRKRKIEDDSGKAKYPTGEKVRWVQ